MFTNRLQQATKATAELIGNHYRQRHLRLLIRDTPDGWTNQGLMLVFNKVFKETEQDRIDCPNFDDNYAAWAAQFVKSKRPARRKRREVVAMYNTLSAFSIAANTNPQY
jgi:hypothetical protein